MMIVDGFQNTPFDFYPVSLIPQVLQSFISDKHKIKNYSAGIESRSRIQQ
jgi:hypothetical protein